MAGLTLSLHTAAITGLSPDKFWNAGLFMLLSAFVLSRLLLIAANPRSFLTYPLLLLTLPSLSAMGILLTMIATLIYLRVQNLKIFSALDAWSPCATVVWCFLAVGHFAEGTDAGLPTGLPWGLSIPPGNTPLHPVALYAALAAALLTGVLLRQVHHRRHLGDTFAFALASAGMLQFLLTFFRQPYPYVESDATLLDPIQWIALAMIVLAGLVVLLQPRKLVAHAV
jgi:phosphatidylglycerol:prolipoprotein diacylglycerol transferase